MEGGRNEGDKDGDKEVEGRERGGKERGGKGRVSEVGGKEEEREG